MLIPTQSAAQNVQTEPGMAGVAVPEGPTVAQRAAALRESLGDEPVQPDGGEEGSDTGTKAPPAAKPEAESEKNAADKRAADRMARLDAWRAKERENQERREAKKQVKASTSEVEKLRARIAELEPTNKVFESEEALLAAAEAKGMSSEKIVDWMRKRLSDPGAVAQRQAKTIEDTLRGEMKLLQDRIDKQEQTAKAKEEAAKAEATGANKAKSFISIVASKSAENPHAAAFLSRHGERGLIAFANQFIVPLLPEDYSNEALHDHMEQILENLQVGPAKTGAPAASANGTSQNTPKKTAGNDKPVTTLSNAIANERSSVTEEIPLSQMTLKERAARLKAQLDRE